MVSPSGAQVFKTTWSVSVPTYGTWLYACTRGDYGAQGTYFAEVHEAGSLLGWIPLNFSSSG